MNEWMGEMSGLIKDKWHFHLTLFFKVEGFVDLKVLLLQTLQKYKNDWELLCSQSMEN